MRANKTTIKTLELTKDGITRTLIAHDRGVFFLATSDGIMQYNTEEMKEMFELSDSQISTAKSTLEIK